MRSFNDKTGTIFAHSKLKLKEWYFTIYTFLQFNSSIRQIEAELNVSYQTLRERVEQFARPLDASSVTLSGPVEIDEVYVSAGLKGRERDQEPRSRGRASYAGDKPPVFTLVVRGSNNRYVIPAKSANESTVRLLLDNHDEESLTVYTDGFRAYDPLDDDDIFDRKFVVHSDGEYADEDVHINTCESHGSLVRPGLSPHRGVSKDKLTPYLRAFQLRRELYRKPGDEALKHAIDAVL